jgi:hypothetical protein
MDITKRRVADQMERAGYLPALRDIARLSCAPLWWHGESASGDYRIRANGTATLVRLGGRDLVISARHVYQGYVEARRLDPDLVCQLGSATVRLDEHLVAIDSELDLVTLAPSPLQLALVGARANVPFTWPPSRNVTEADMLIYGGYPGSLRREGGAVADLSFQWFVSSPISVTSAYIKLHVDFTDFHEPLVGVSEINRVLGGISGGPVFRFIPAPPIERLELVGFVVESAPEFGLVFARPAHCIRSDGTLDPDAAK